MGANSATASSERERDKTSRIHHNTDIGGCVPGQATDFGRLHFEGGRHCISKETDQRRLHETDLGILEEKESGLCINQILDRKANYREEL